MKCTQAPSKPATFRAESSVFERRSSARQSYRLLMIASSAVMIGLMLIGLFGSQIA